MLYVLELLEHRRRDFHTSVLRKSQGDTGKEVFHRHCQVIHVLRSLFLQRVSLSCQVQYFLIEFEHSSCLRVNPLFKAENDQGEGKLQLHLRRRTCRSILFIHHCVLSSAENTICHSPPQECDVILISNRHSCIRCSTVYFSLSMTSALTMEGLPQT